MRTAVVLTLLLVAAGAAGCMGGKGKALPQPTDADGLVTIQGLVLLPDGTPAQDAALKLVRPDARFYETRTDDAGRFSFRIEPLEQCEIEVNDGERRTRFALQCLVTQEFLLRIELPTSTGPTVSRPPTSGGPLPGGVELAGTVRDANGGLPLSDVFLKVTGPAGTSQSLTTNATGQFLFHLAKAVYRVDATGTCFEPYSSQLDLRETLALQILLTPLASGAPTAPPSLRAQAGPGHGQVSLAWDPQSGGDCASAYRYRIYRGASASELVPHIVIGNSLTYLDSGLNPGDTYHYAASALNRAGAEGPRSTAASAAAATSDVAPVNVVPAPVPITVTSATFPTLDPSGTPVGTQTWRIAQGVGNCCENYFVTTATGRILDFGGTYLRYSDDEGKTWMEVPTPYPFTGGEGAVAAAPGGDVVAVGWTVYTGDVLWAHRYSASDDKWSFQLIPLKSPFYDRPWIGTIKGPFLVDGQLVPYATLVRSSAGANGYITYVAHDGLTYAPVAPLVATLPLASDISLPTRLAPDPERDWIQPHLEARMAPITDRLGYYSYDQGSTTCPSDWVLPNADLSWGCPAARNTFPNGVSMLADSDGRLHALDVLSGNEGLRYRMSPDVGGTWQELEIELPQGWTLSFMDVKVDSAHDQAAIAVHALTDRPGSLYQDLVYRVRLSSGAPVLEEILAVGLGDLNLGSNVASTTQRMDFTNVAFLPDGRLVTSFTDSSSDSPQIAIEV